ncbi:MAG: FG-GAP-like repeat-containing protein [bacterium]
MKNTVFFIIASLILFSAGDSFAQNINTAENFPDPSFRVVVETFVGVEPGGVFTAAEAAAKSGTLNCQNRKIHDLTGIEYFTGITTLWCQRNELVSLDVSHNVALASLKCFNNPLTELDISKNANLTELLCYRTELKHLDVSQHPSLQILQCYQTQLTALNAVGAAALQSLNCSESQLETLNASGAAALKYLDCSKNQLTTLDLTGATALMTLYCMLNQLTELDLSNRTQLEYLYCYDNQLTSLNVSGATALTRLNCDYNFLTHLDLSGATALIHVDCRKNYLSNLDLSAAVDLEDIDCSRNYLRDLDVSSNTHLRNLSCGSNQLTNLDVSNNTELEYLSCYYNLLTTLDVSNNVLLRSLDCRNNKLTQVDISNNPNLETFVFGEQNTEGSPAGNVSLNYCFDVALSEDGTVLYVPDGAGTHVLSVSQFGLEYVQTLRAGGGYHRNIKVSGDHAYIADAESGLVVLDISIADSPSISSIAIPGAGMGVFVKDDLAYLASGEEGLKIIDIADPTSPSLVSVADTPGSAWDVWVVGDYAYVADLEKGMAVIDVSTPTAPRYVRNIGWLKVIEAKDVKEINGELASDSDENNNMAEIIRGSGNLVHIAAGIHGLVTVDISDPENPVVKDIFKSGLDGYGEGLAVEGTTVYLANGNNSDSSQNGLYIIDASDPDDLEVIGKKIFSGWLEGVIKSGNGVFVANTRFGVRMIDVSRRDAPYQIYHWYGQSSIPTPSPDDWFKEITDEVGFYRSGTAISFAVEDNDNDGDLDIYVFGGGVTTDALYQNQGDLSFVDIAETAGLPEWKSLVAGAWADANGDGAPDLVLGDSGSEGLFLNDGSGGYTQASGSGIKPAEGWSVWLDINRDNALDLVTYGSDLQTRLYKNLGNGTFQDIAEEAGIAFQSTGNHAVSGFDCERDGYVEILFGQGYIFSEEDYTSPVLWHNNGNETFTKYERECAITAQNNEMHMPAIGDFNRDGQFDLYTPRHWDLSAIVVNNGDGTFYKERQWERGDALMDQRFYAHGACTGDCNNDGYMDVAVMEEMSGRLFEGLAGLRFSEITAAAGFIAPGGMRSAVWADLDGDLDLDLLAVDEDGNLRLYENRAPAGNALLVIPLTDSDGNVTDTERGRTAVGAVVEVDLDGDGDFAAGETDTLLIRDISAGAAGRSQPWAHFGLGEAEVVDVRVTFPDGTVVDVPNIPANERIIVRDREETGVFDYVLY